MQFKKKIQGSQIFAFKCDLVIILDYLPTIETATQNDIDNVFIQIQCEVTSQTHKMKYIY